MANLTVLTRDEAPIRCGSRAYVTVLWALGLDRTLDGVAHPDADIHDKTLEASRQPTRAAK